MLSANQKKGLRNPATPWIELVAGPGFEPGTFGDGYPKILRRCHPEESRKYFTGVNFYLLKETVTSSVVTEGGSRRIRSGARSPCV